MKPEYRCGTARRAARAVVPLLCLGLAACDATLLPAPQPDRTRFFVLSGAGAAAAEAMPRAAGVRVGLRAVEVPDYLRDRPIAVRRGANELLLNDYDRWAEPLDAGIQRVIVQQLLAEPNVSDVVTAPFPINSPPDYVVSVRILRCEGDTGAGAGSARLSAEYQISTPGPDSKLVAQRFFVAPAAPWGGQNYGRLARLLSADVAALARAIASDVPAKGS
ncbi:MAG: PqiC family protein [Opitutaceae bacterium]